MIFVDRTVIKAPAILSSPKAEKAFQQAKEFYSHPLTSRVQQRHTFDMQIWKEARPILKEIFRGKCAYCERGIASDEIGDVDQFRPKAGAINQSGKFDPDHYWWLTYEWSNLYFSCRLCNTSKGSRFPVAGARVEVPKGSKARLGAPWYVTDLREEKPLLLDPCAEEFDPDEHLVFDASTGLVAGLTKEGKATIEILNLNRPALKESRGMELTVTVEALKRLDSITRKPVLTAHEEDMREDIFKILREAQYPSSPYAGAQRQIIRRWYLERDKKTSDDFTEGQIYELLWKQAATPQAKKAKTSEVGRDAARSVSSIRTERLIRASIKEKKTRQERTVRRASLNPQFITRIEIHNFRIIEDLVLDFPPMGEEEKSWLVLLGENGVGKSSVLKALALALMDEDQYSVQGFKAEKILRVGSQSGYVKVYLTDYSEPFEVRFDKRGFRKANKNKLQSYLFGYGGTRLPPQSDHKPAPTNGVSRTENLFDPFLPLIDAKSWLLSLKWKPFGYSSLALKDLLVREAEDKLFRRNGLVKLRLADFGASISLEELSDGYQSIVALIADILNVMLRTWPTADKSQGIVLIDEIDVHLHPRWKIEIVNRLRRVFPRVQFVVTTHDPLCLLGTRPGEVHVLHRDAASERVVATQFDVPPGTTADKILTGFWFGLPSTLDRGTLKLLEDYYELMRARQTAATRRRLRDLETELRVRLGNFTDTSVDRMAQSVAAEILQEGYLTWDPQTRGRKREEIKDRVAKKISTTRSRGRAGAGKAGAKKIGRRGRARS